MVIKRKKPNKRAASVRKPARKNAKTIKRKAARKTAKKPAMSAQKTKKAVNSKKKAKAKITKKRVRKLAASKPLSLPKDVMIALEGNRVRDIFDGLKPSNQREFLRWIEGTKKLETRIARIEKMVEQLKFSKSSGFRE